MEKNHQRGHPGESSLKRCLRMYFWCPNLNKAISNKVKACLPCQAHTHKPTKEPQAMLQLPRSAWDKVSLDLFGPTPVGKHIFVAQDMLTRFPAAHIVPGTKASSVLPALDNIYVSYGYPDIHITDNALPPSIQNSLPTTQDRKV